jgi:ubiquinone/menaquinone biosynthesis C-methylase UbiE
MHQQNLSRLSDTNNHKSSCNYLHYLSLHKDVKNAIAEYANGKVLDIGCGNKPYEKEFLENSKEYIGCDIVQSSLQKVDVICDATNLPFHAGEFDAVFSLQTIEHIAEHQQMLNEAYRVLKPGGYIVVSGPFYWPLHEEPYDYFRFTANGFSYVFHKAGFTVENIIENGGSWATSGQAFVHSMMNSQSRNLFLRFLRFVFFRLNFIKAHNSFYSWLDKIDNNTAMPMNYIVIAKK